MKNELMKLHKECIKLAWQVVEDINYAVEYKEAFYFENFERKTGVFVLKDSKKLMNYEQFLEYKGLKDLKKYTDKNLLADYEIIDGEFVEISHTFVA